MADPVHAPLPVAAPPTRSGAGLRSAGRATVARPPWRSTCWAGARRDDAVVAPRRAADDAPARGGGETADAAAL